MPNIELNADNIKKFAKRLQKNVVNHDIKLTLSQSQELLAKTLGATNFNELIKKFDTVSITVNDEVENNNQEEKIYEGFNPYTFFVDSFNKLLAREDSSISLCVIQHIEDFEYKIYIKSYFDCEYKINFNLIAFNEMEDEMINAGFSRKDAAQIKLILNCSLLNADEDSIYEDRYYKRIAPYDSLLFAKNLWIFLNKENTLNKKNHIMKIDLESNANKKIMLINGQYYIEDSYHRVDGDIYRKDLAPYIKKTGGLPIDCYKYFKGYSPAFNKCDDPEAIFYILMNIVTRETDIIKFVKKPK